jgi:hypothetical protein
MTLIPIVPASASEWAAIKKNFPNPKELGDYKKLDAANYAGAEIWQGYESSTKLSDFGYLKIGSGTTISTGNVIGKVAELPTAIR